MALEANHLTLGGSATMEFTAPLPGVALTTQTFTVTGSSADVSIVVVDSVRVHTSWLQLLQL